MDGWMDTVDGLLYGYVHVDKTNKQADRLTDRQIDLDTVDR